MRRKNLKRKVRRKLGTSAVVSHETASTAKPAPRETRLVRHEKGRQGFALADR
jgi:hypothetical protein